MSNEFRKAYVYINDSFSGILSENDSGYVFEYDSDYLKKGDYSPVSLTLPLREAPYRSKVLFPFFDGLIPEGWLLNVVSDNWKINKNDRFGILLVAANDGIGNVSVRKDKTE